MQRLALLLLAIPTIAHADVAPEPASSVATGAIILVLLGLVVAGAIWLAKRKR